MYEKYFTQYEVEYGVEGDVFLLVRLDMPNPNVSGSASLFYGIDKNNNSTCSFIQYNYQDDLYNLTGFERGYFLDTFAYNSVNASTFMGVPCTAYKYEAGDETKIWYVNSENMTIGYEYLNLTYVHRVWNVTYQFYAEQKDFRIPAKYPGCSEEVYKDIETDPECALTYVPTKPPCTFKFFYHEDYDTFVGENKTTRKFDGFVAMYNKYHTQFEIEAGVPGDVFLSIRLDMPNPKDPETASYLLGKDKNDKKSCDFVQYNPYSNLYNATGKERGYFLEPFTYNSTSQATFKGTACTAYSYEANGEMKIWYVNSEGFTIGYEYKNQTFVHRVWNATYDLNVDQKDFKMPSKYPGCPEQAYTNIKTDPKCYLPSPSPSSSSGGHHSHSSGASTVEIAFATVFLAIALCLLAIF